MKKIILITFIFVLLFSLAQARTIREKEARQLLEKAFSDLKTSDTTSFINLWLIDNSPYPYHKKPFTKEDVKGYFNYLKDFMDTALTQNLKIDHVNIEKCDPKDTKEYFGEYKIKAWFKYREHYYKGFGFYVDYKNDKWVIRFSPDTSTMTKN